MSQVVRIRRGTQAALPILGDGRLGFTTDTHRLYVGLGGANYQIGGAANVMEPFSSTASITVSYDEADTIYFDVNVCGSLEITANPGTGTEDSPECEGIQLVNDEEAPGRLYAYMTDQDGVKGWFSLEALFALLDPTAAGGGDPNYHPWTESGGNTVLPSGNLSIVNSIVVGVGVITPQIAGGDTLRRCPGLHVHDPRDQGRPPV